jgi:hypothetical protein
MFDNINEHSLWDLTAQGVKSQDMSTTQMLYDGVNRGQTERYMIIVGRLLEDLFETIELAFTYNDPMTTPVDNLKFLQKRYIANFLDASIDANTEARVRYILEEIISAWKLKGSKGFIHWILWTVFGWQLIEIHSRNSIFFLNDPLCVTYYPGLVKAKTKRLMAPTYIKAGGEVEMVIDVFNDAQFTAKSELLDSLKDDWFIPTTFIFENQP